MNDQSDHNSTLWRRAVITATCFLVGIAIAAQWRSQANMAKAPLVASSVDQALLMRNLVENNAQLRDEVRSLERQATALSEDTGQETMRTMVGELSQLRIANGLAEVTGPGIEIRVSGPIGVYDIQDLINELRNAGAEGIALNGQRIVVNSVIAERGQRLTIDGITSAAPYTFLAIGDPATLLEACTRRGGTLDLLQSSVAGVEATTENRQEIVLPVYRRSYQFTYAAVER
jgi:uncharacterized protein YlxW (UPF0749 family)